MFIKKKLNQNKSTVCLKTKILQRTPLLPNPYKNLNNFNYGNIVRYLLHNEGCCWIN